MDQKIIELLNKKLTELKNILVNNEFLIDTQYDYVDKKNLDKKLKKIKELVEDKNTDVEVIMLHKNIWKPLYNILVYDLLKKYEKQQKYNSVIRYWYFFAIVVLLAVSSYIFLNPPIEKEYEEKIVYQTWIDKTSISNIYELYKNEVVSDKELQELIAAAEEMDEVEEAETIEKEQVKEELQETIEEEEENADEEISEAEQDAQEQIDQIGSYEAKTVLNINLRESPGTANPIITVIPSWTDIQIVDYDYVEGNALYQTS